MHFSLSGQFDQLIEDVFAVFRRGASGKPGAGAFFGVGHQGELRDQQQFTFDVQQGTVHAAFIIGKYAVAQQFVQQFFSCLDIILTLHPDQRQDALVDLANDFIIDLNMGLLDPLNQYFHDFLVVVNNECNGIQLIQGKR